MPIRTAVVGFGLAGQVFHAPFLTTDDAYALELVVTASPERAAVATLDDALAARPDLVVVATPPASHVRVARAALEAGSAVVIDKPMSTDVADGRALIERAEELGRPLTVFQNRRWDGDFRTVQRLVADGALGRVHRFESRFERWKPQEPKAWKAESSWREGGGALFDFGSHLIDQALVLFGPARLAHAELSRHHRAAEDDVFLALEHDEGVTSHLWMSNVAGQPGPRLRVLGSAGAFTRTAGDIQEVQLGQGMMPTDPRYGRSEPADDGVLGVAGDLSPVRTELGSYQTFYTMLAAALRGQGRRDNPAPYREAEKLLLEVLKEDPANLAASFNLGLLYADFLKQPAKAAPLLKQFLANAPEDHPERAVAQKRLAR